MNPPQFALKLIVCLHFILTVLALTDREFLPFPYGLCNVFVSFMGIWSIAHNESSDSILLFLILHVFSILEDILLLGIYQPLRAGNVEQDSVAASIKNRYRFSLGMAIINVILKPFTAFLLFRIFKERGGSYGELNIPGISNLPGFSSPTGNYEDIDRNPGVMDPGPPQHHDEEKPPLH